MLRNAPNEDSNIVGEVVFTSDAPAYTITMAPLLDAGFSSVLEFHGAGIINSSLSVQNFYAPATGSIHASGRFYFFGSASAGENVVITNGGSDSNEDDGNYGGFTSFDDTSTAAKATIISQGGTVAGAVWGGFANLFDNSNAESATFITQPGTVSGAPAGHTLVQTFAPGNIGKSTFINNPATVAGAEGGWSEIDVGICAGASFIAKGSAIAGAQGGQVYVYGGSGNATFSGEGGTASNGQGGLIDLFALPNSAQTVVIAKAGKSDGLGGHIVIENKAVVDLGQFRLLGNGWLDLSAITNGKTAIGSLAGSGLVSTAGQMLTVGNNNLDTTFSGMIEESGGLSKVGTGSLTLSGANTYTGGTTVSAGSLLVDNTSGSATGTKAVKVNGGTLGGNGIIAGAVTLGTGSGSGAFLAPAGGTAKPATLTIQKAITFNSDATYICTLQASKKKSANDEVVADGLTINSGAQFNLVAKAQGKLKSGTSFTVISNTASSPISGTFANLADGATLTVGNTNLQASYEGGDGNDLVLTVVQ
jgi:autotransporter-associated beta strand protein